MNSLYPFAYWPHPMQANPETSPSYSPSAQTAPEDISRIRIPAILYAFGTDTPSYLI